MGSFDQLLQDFTAQRYKLKIMIPVLKWLSCLALLFSLPCASLARNSTKKGLGFGKNFMCGDVEAFSNLNWYYKWNTEFHPECGPQPEPGYFIPMIYGYYGEVPDIEADPFDSILGFNEPNHKHTKLTGSDLTPEEAAFAWIEIQEKYPNKILVSPCASAAHKEDAIAWFDQFFDICSELGCRIDYLATHDYSGNVDMVMDALYNLYQRFGRKVWLTEFARSNTKNEDVVLKYMQEILPRLEEADYIWKYAWYVARYADDAKEVGKNGSYLQGNGDWYVDKINSLLEVNADTPILTKVGKFYDEFQPNF